MTTQKQIAEHLGISQQAVSSQMAALGIDWKTTALDQIRLTYCENLRAQAAGHRSNDGLDLTRERALNERVDRELKEITLAEKKGQVVAVAAVEAEMSQMVVAFRTELLARDDKLKTDLDALYGTEIDLQILNDFTHETLSQLARYDPECASIGASDVGVDGSPAADDDD